MIGQEIIDFINSSAFQNLVKYDNIQIAQFNAFLTLLIKRNIPFDVEYKTGTRRDEPVLSVTIYITPTITLTYNFKGLAENN